MDRSVIAADRLQALDNKAKTEELHHYLARSFGLVGVISPIGISSAITERQTPLPSICLPEDLEKASSRLAGAFISCHRKLVTGGE